MFNFYFYSACLSLCAAIAYASPNAAIQVETIPIDASCQIYRYIKDGVVVEEKFCNAGLTPVSEEGWRRFDGMASLQLNPAREKLILSLPFLRITRRVSPPDGSVEKPGPKMLSLSLPCLSITKRLSHPDGSVERSVGFPIDVPTFYGELEPYVGEKYAALVRHADGFFTQSYPAYSQFPEGDAPCPLVILLHGSGGIQDPSLFQYIDAFSKRGFACVTMNRFAGIMEDSSKNQRKLLPEQEVMMTYALREVLSTHPRLQGQPCHLIGYSRGANVALDCMQERHTALYGFCFASAVCYYVLPVMQWPLDPRSRVLFLHGEEDDYTRPEPLKKYLQRLNPDIFASATHFTELGGRHLDDTPSHTHMISGGLEEPKFEAFFYDQTGHGFDFLIGKTWTIQLQYYLYEWMGRLKVPLAENYSNACVIATPEGFIPVADSEAHQGESAIKPWSEALSYLASKVYYGVNFTFNQMAAKHAFGKALRWMHDAQ